MNVGYVRTLKEATVPYVKVLSRYSPGEAEKNHE